MKIKLTENDFIRHLKEQIGFLLLSCDSYDKGFLGEYARIATVIRVLVHDTSKSISLLKHLNKKDMLFYDTGRDYDPRASIQTPGLVMLQLGKSGQGIVPKCLDSSRENYNKILFVNWWEKIVLWDKNKNTFTRKDLILTASNQDGGAHVDPELNSIYAGLLKFETLGWTVMSTTGKSLKVDSGKRIVGASIRQIGYEVLISLKEEFPDYLNIYTKND